MNLLSPLFWLLPVCLFEKHTSTITTSLPVICGQTTMALINTSSAIGSIDATTRWLKVHGHRRNMHLCPSLQIIVSLCRRLYPRDQSLVCACSVNDPHMEHYVCSSASSCIVTLVTRTLTCAIQPHCHRRRSRK